MINRTLLIRGADICDGLGSESYRGDILLRDGIIAEIGKIREIPEDAGIFDADGLTACPGFIDSHAHSDLSLFAAPEAYGKISQGITTEISGNCGLSAFPVMTNTVREHLQSLYSRYGVEIDWSDFTGFADALESRHPAINAAFLCGYNTLRANILGYEDAPNSPEDWRKMRGLLTEMLKQGAFGLSTGLLYVPGVFASQEELLAVAEALRPFHAVYATHLRSEGKTLLESVEEALAIAEAGAKHLHISHLKTAKSENWYKIDPLMDRIAQARKDGIRLTADRYPYTFAQTSLSVILPAPYDVMTDASIEKLLSTEPERREPLIRELETSGVDWNRILICCTKVPVPEEWYGLPLAEIAEKSGRTPARICAELLTGDGGTLAAFGGMSEQNLRRIISDPEVCCGTDETARPRDFQFGRSHPRGFGSFGRFIRMGRELFPKEELIRKLTSFPASVFGFRDRGILKKGYAADLLLLDWENYADRADFGHPHEPCSGVVRVYVNGILGYDSGKVTGSGGCVLRKICSKEG